jgi:hypothetical protein
VSGPRRTAFAVAASVAVVAAVVAGMFALGSPAEQRARRLDQRRLDDLRALAGGIEYEWRSKQSLPRSLDELPVGFAQSSRDPATGEPYEYSVHGENGYQLCAVFDRDDTADVERPWAGLDHVTAAIWKHSSGRYCYELEASSEPHH